MDKQPNVEQSNELGISDRNSEKGMVMQQRIWIPLYELIKEVGVVWNGRELIILTKSLETGGWVEGTSGRPELMEIVNRYMESQAPGVSRFPRVDAIGD